MEPTTWTQDTALEWHHTYTEWTYLHGSQFQNVTELADHLRRLNSRFAQLQRGSRMTNAQMNSRFLTLCGQMGHEEMVRDLSLKQSRYMFSGDERSWTSFDEVVARFISFESWQRGERNGATRTQSNEQRPPRGASLEQQMNNVSLNGQSPRHQPPPSWEQSAPAYTNDNSSDYYRDEKPPVPEVRKQPEVQKRPLQRSGTQRAFDFMARQSQMPQVPVQSVHDPMPDPDDLAPPPSLLSPREIKDKRSSRKSMRYDTEEFMS
jgi:hypothetical protein